ncbi:MAG TPA: methyltransferase domain-containing protein [Pyrinomonadaceae bacterium]|nr:methyltransferase domain-containing protein [Pyrinomonadaceae bacterium]
MRESLLEVLVDPVSKGRLRVEATRAEGGEIIEGWLRGDGGRGYAIAVGIPRFVLTEDEGQRQTEGSFGFKWRQRYSYESEEFAGGYHRWLRQKYGFASDEEMRDFFCRKRRTLEVGCGGGLSASVSLSCGGQGQEWVGVDISRAVEIARDRLGHMRGAHFVQADILQLPFRERSFDAIFAEGVLHHTPSTELALKSLCPLLAAGGEIMFYVYRKKGPVREFTDDYVRGLVSGLPPQEAWEMLLPLTRLGQALAELRAEVEVPEDIPYLGIKAGRHDVQRLIYWHFAKMFWNPDYPFETNHHINFDWYHPRYAHRQTEEEVRRWCGEAGLSVVHLDEQESGFTVRAVKE